MSERIGIRARADSLASHILPVSGTMIGVCTTLIGLVKLAEAKYGPSDVDEYAAIAAVTFLASALTSYLRSAGPTALNLAFGSNRSPT